MSERHVTLLDRVRQLRREAGRDEVALQQAARTLSSESRGGLTVVGALGWLKRPELDVAVDGD